MTKRKVFKWVAYAYVGYMTFDAFLSVGDVPFGCSEPFPPWLPLVAFIFMALPVAIGYYWGSAE